MLEYKKLNQIFKEGVGEIGYLPAVEKQRSARNRRFLGSEATIWFESKENKGSTFWFTLPTK